MNPPSFDNIEYLSSLDCGFDRYGSFSQNDDCPSMTSSFLTINTSGASFNSDGNERRGSISPENFTISSGRSVASPLTPAYLNETHPTAVWPKQEDNNPWYHHDSDVNGYWIDPEEADMAHVVIGFGQQDLPMLPPGYVGLGRRSRSNVDPPLSRAVFANPISQQEEHTTVDGMLSWPQRLELAYPSTIAPNVTFHNVMPSSPASAMSPMTPLKHHRYSSSMLASSPLTSNSSSVLTSQWSGDEETNYIPVINTPDCHDKKDLSLLLDSSPVRYVDRDSSSPVKAHTSRSGVDCEPVIPQNVFACSVSGCVDKDGRPKRFRRQEHKKRHEKTVHKKDSVFPCWVQTGGKPCGKKFTRRDNLNSHLKKTHGSRKNNQRNSYVATLDEKSKYFDEKWKGKLTADGLPIGHPRWPELR